MDFVLFIVFYLSPCYNGFTFLFFDWCRLCVFLGFQPAFVLFVDINITLKIVFVNTKKDVFIANYLLRF